METVMDDEESGNMSTQKKREMICGMSGYQGSDEAEN